MRKYEIEYSVQGNHTFDRYRHGSADMHTIWTRRSGIFFILGYGRKVPRLLEEKIKAEIKRREQYNFDQWDKVVIEYTAVEIHYEVINA